jgi:parallel beta-helix repeat protein
MASRIHLAARLWGTAACLLWASAAQATVWTIKPSCAGVDNCFTHLQGAITVDGRQLSLLNDWSFMQPGDVVRVYPAASASGWRPLASSLSAATLNVNQARGRQGAPIVVRGYGTRIAQGVNIRGSQYVELSGFNITESRSGRPAVAINTASADITVRGNVIRNAPLNGVDINGAGPHIVIGPANLIRNNVGNGIGIRTSGLDTATGTIGSRVSGNIISGNARHGLELESSYWLIEGNTVQDNGTGVGGTSGLHLFSATDAAIDDCDHNELRYNRVSGQVDKRFADGNGIQIDHFCDANSVHHNVAWGNDGAGISVFMARGNQVFSNTLYQNAQDTARWTRSPDAWRGELILASMTRVCVNNTDAGACLGWYEVPAQRSGDNQIYDNLIQAHEPNVPALMVSSDILNRHVNRFTPNLVFHDQGGPVAFGGEPQGGVSGRTQAEVNRFVSNAGYDFLLVEPPAYVNAASPQKGSDGLRLSARPSRDSQPLAVPAADILGRPYVSGKPYWGAYDMQP